MSTVQPKLPPIHPGEILRTDFLAELNLSQNQLATALDVPAGRINQIVTGKRTITADTALRLARYFGTSAQFWLNLQNHYDLEVAEDAAAAQIARKIKPRAAI
jgi:addiction module HigA family antidote